MVTWATAYFVKQVPHSDSFLVLKAFALADFIEDYKLTITGIDYSRQTSFQIDSVFIKKGRPLNNGLLDTTCVESNFYDFYISYSLTGRALHRDSILSSNTTGGHLFETFHTERTAEFTEDSVFRGYNHYGSKVFCDKGLNFVFIRTKYILTEYQTKPHTGEVEVIDPVTYQKQIIVTKSTQWKWDEKHIRKLLQIELQ
jgi:hypothetical protein